MEQSEGKYCKIGICVLLIYRDGYERWCCGSMDFLRCFYDRCDHADTAPTGTDSLRVLLATTPNLQDACSPRCQLETYYHLSYTTVSLIFLTPFAGYSLAAFTNANIHSRLGQRGIAILAPLCHIVTYAILSAHPPFPVLVVFNAISGFGNGLTDACFCAWIGGMDKGNAVQGCLHSCYSLGALFAPLIATSMVVHAKLPWYNFYYFMVSTPLLAAAVVGKPECRTVDWVTEIM